MFPIVGKHNHPKWADWNTPSSPKQLQRTQEMILSIQRSKFYMHRRKHLKSCYIKIFFSFSWKDTDQKAHLTAERINKIELLIPLQNLQASKARNIKSTFCAESNVRTLSFFTSTFHAALTQKPLKWQDYKLWQSEKINSIFSRNLEINVILKILIKLFLFKTYIQYTQVPIG